MNEPDKTLETVLEDVKTIKAILLNQDAPLPPVWRLLYFVLIPLLVGGGLVKFLVPPVASLGFLDTLLFLWVPLISMAALVVVWQVRRDLKKTGTRFMAQGRVRTFLYTRVILAPALITVAILLSFQPTYSMEGAMLILVAVALTQVAIMVPTGARWVPAVFLAGGWIELAAGFQGPWWTFLNTLALAGACYAIGKQLELTEQQERHHG